MENQPIIEKILASTQTLMTLKVDNEELVKNKFRTIRDLVADLSSPVAEENDRYSSAFNVIKLAINTEYKQFCEASSYEQKEQALIQLRHKAAEVCAMLQVS